MSTLKEFTSTLAENFNEQMKNTDIRVEMRIMQKNNNIEKIGLVFLQKGRNISTVVYTEPFQKAYEQGIPMKSIKKEIITLVREHEQENINIEQILDFQKIKHRLSLKLVNRKYNEERLKNMPHMNIWEDMACICYIALDEPQNGKIDVSNELAEKWNVSESSLMQTAMENTEKLHPAEIYDFQKLMQKAGMIDGTEKTVDFPMYVITNRERWHGAVCVLYKGILRRIAKNLDSDLIMIPSSLHEMIVLPKKKNSGSVKEMNQMVKEVNESQLEPDEVLSDHVYLYLKDTEDICSLAD